MTDMGKSLVQEDWKANIPPEKRAEMEQIYGHYYTPENQAYVQVCQVYLYPLIFSEITLPASNNS